MAEVNMEENANNPGTENYVIEKKSTSAIKSICSINIWKALSVVLFIIIFFLILDICDVFNDSSSSSDESSEQSTDDQSPSGSVASNFLVQPIDDQYLTGSAAPNILFLLADDIGWADVSVNGGKFDTPNIDELLTAGVQFTNFYSLALCTPSRMAFLTGRHAWKLGVQYPEVIHGLMTGHIPPDELTFAEVTREMGYNNYYVGRWGVGYASWDYTPLGRGWDKFMGYFGPEGGYYNHSTDHFDEWTDVYDMWDMQDAYIEANMTYSEDIFYDRTIQYLNEARSSGKPFTLTYSSQTAHAPIDDDWPTMYPPIIWDDCEDDYDGREYYCNKVKYLDYIWGLILDYLKDNGFWENMLVFVTSDNGALPYTGGDLWSDWGCNWPYRGGKVTHFDGGIKVWAGMTGGLVPNDYQGSTFDSLTHITDFAATAMRLAMKQSDFDERDTLTGTDKNVDGKNLFLLENHELVIHNVMPQYIPSWMFREAFSYAATDGEWKYLVGHEDSAAQGHGWYNFPGYGYIDGDSDPETYAEAGANCTKGCLFHLTTDPYEYHDLSDDYSEVANYFSDMLNALVSGALDESYHSGQPYEEDLRGWMADDILRPYLNKLAIEDYGARLHSSANDGNYDYSNAPVSYISDYDRAANPFES